MWTSRIKRKLVVLLCGAALFGGSCAGERTTTFTFLCPTNEHRAMAVETAGGRTALTFEAGDSARQALLTLPLRGGEYARLWVGDLPYTVWMEEGRPWTAEFKWNTWQFTGEGAAENRYLNGAYLNQVYFVEYYRIPNKQFREKLEVVMAEREDSLRAVGLDGAFVGLERKRLKYVKEKHVASGVIYGETIAGKPDTAAGTMADLRRAMEEDTSAWRIPEYREAKYLTLSALARLDGEERDVYRTALGVLRMAEDSFRDERLVSYVVARKVDEYLRNTDLGDMVEMDALFRRWVRDSAAVVAYKDIVARTRKLAKGRPAAAFTFEDTEGKPVSLSDFRGKYVYIDLWATWCGPCNAEIPHLRRLEERLRGKSIVFVGISSDKDKEAWKRFVKERELGGVQLFMNGDRRFMEEIHCEGIPRFLLIDREGNYVDADMSRPSDPATLSALEGLPGL